MKMSEVFKLPFTAVRHSESLSLGEYCWFVIDERQQHILDNVTKEVAEAIIKAVNSHDTQLADIDRLLDRLEPFAELAQPDHKGRPRPFTPEDIDLAHQTYTELRETYPKEEKDEKT